MTGKLEVALDLTYVKYDGHIYKDIKVSRIPRKVRKHKCSDNRYYSIGFRWSVKLKDGQYIVDFCNRCKTLFMDAV